MASHLGIILFLDFGLRVMPIISQTRLGAGKNITKSQNISTHAVTVEGVRLLRQHGYGPDLAVAGFNA